MVTPDKVNEFWIPGIFALVTIIVISNFAPKVAFWVLLLISLVLLINAKDYVIWALRGDIS